MAGPVAEKPSWAEALGDQGARLTVDVGGKTYFLTTDSPKLIASIERVCTEYARDEVSRIVADLPDHDKPGTMDYDLALQIKQQHIQRHRSGAYKPPLSPKRPDGSDNEGGEYYAEWVKTDQGKIGVVLAAMRPDHPEMTMTELIQLFVAEPTKMTLLMEELGNRVRAQAARMKAN